MSDPKTPKMGQVIQFKGGGAQPQGKGVFSREVSEILSWFDDAEQALNPRTLGAVRMLAAQLDVDPDFDQDKQYLLTKFKELLRVMGDSMRDKKNRSQEKGEE